ncbi:MAG: hypothetical protein IPH72_32350 [Sandaracinaceae bacterium]|nr:hypothetical protein [Sandaracinaceae bacterium]
MRRELLARLRKLDAEYVVVDLGAGTADALLDAYLGADVALFVSLPEPPAVEHTYRFARSLFARSLRSEDPHGSRAGPPRGAHPPASGRRRLSTWRGSWKS